MNATKNYAEKKLGQIDIEETFKIHVRQSISALKKELPKFQEIIAAVLFGSISRGDFSSRHSDMDVMIFFNLKDKNQLLEEKIRKKILELSLGKKVNVHIVFQYKKVKEEDRSLMLTLSKEGKIIFSRGTIVLSEEILGLVPYYLIKFDTTDISQVVKNKLQRFLHGYTFQKKHYAGITESDKIITAGKGAIIVPEELREKVLLFAQKIRVKAVQAAKVYR